MQLSWNTPVSGKGFESLVFFNDFIIDMNQGTFLPKQKVLDGISKFNQVTLTLI